MSMAGNRLQQKVTLPDRVSQLYYAHGLFCSSHPVLVLSCAAFVVLLCCYPLLSIPLPGNAPQQLVGQPKANNATESENLSYGEQASLPRWLSGPPLLYVHQILLRVAVCPWAEDLLLTDAFRAPLSEVFRLLESVANYQHENSSRTLSDVCLHVESAARLKPEQRALLPEYNCLMLSPASLWQQEPGRFLQDPTPLHTVFNYQTLQRGKVSLAEMLLGLNLKDTGIKRYPLRSRQRVLQYAVTLFLRVHDSSFMDGLHHKLRQMYPLHQQTMNTTGSNKTAFSIDRNTFEQLPTIHIYYPGEFSARGLIPLIATYLIMFLYMYFSMRKIELLKSKFGVSVSAVLTVLASLFMSVGLCFFFGLTLTLSGREFYPYLVVIVGLENVFVLTKSVVSTPAHLDVKIRVAQGLSREGWSITKNLLTEVTILTIGLFTLVPAIQEFCIFAIVGLLSDFFLQVVFFSTILAMDIRRAALDSNSQSQSYHSSARQYNPQISRQAQRSTLSRSRSHPRLDLGDYPTSVVAPPIGPTYAPTVLVPKRLRLVHFWARTRIVQRGFMLFMILWIGAIAINSGVVEQLLEASVTSSQADTNSSKTSSVPAANWKIQPPDPPPMMHLPTPLPIDDQSKVSCPRLWSNSPWPHTSPQHWSSILSLYNISLAGNYLTVIPPLRLAMAISPDRARTLRRPGDEDAGGWSGTGAGQWQALVAALDPVDFSSAHDSSVGGGTSHHSSDGSAPFVPQSPMELLLTAILCVVSVGVLAYTTVVLYRCICSRHYAEWRAGWSNSDNEGVAAEKQVVLREAVPLILDGHNQQVEWVCSDSGLICSSCLGGHLRAWDGQSGELLAAVDRTRFFAGLVKQKTTSCSAVSFEDLPLSDYESGSPPSRGDPGGSQDFTSNVKSSIGFGNFPDLRSSICTNFSSSGYSPSSPVDSKHGYDFGDRYSSIFEDFFAQNTSEDLSEWGTSGQNYIPIKSSPPTPIPVSKHDKYSDHQQSSDRRYDIESGHFTQDLSAVENLHFTGNPAPPVWCLDFKDNLLVAGCSNGRLEFWEASTGTFKCIFDDGCGIPVTGVKLVGNRVIAAKLNGAVDFLELESYGSQGRPLDWGFTSIRRTHVRTGSAGSLTSCLRPTDNVEEDVRCRRLHTVRAHQQPITVLDSEGGRVVTGSQDHTLKIFRLEDQRPLYTLHGHCGPITCLFIDCLSPLLSGSGSQDGMLCVWDLLTGACMYSIQAHDGAVSSVTYSASYVITVGADERICVWERFQGHLLNTIILGHSYCSSMVMLTHNLLVTSKQGSLIVWDVRTGEAVRVVRLGGRPSLSSPDSGGGCGILVKQIVLIQPGDSIACDYGNEVRVVRFPVATDKID